MKNKGIFVIIVFLQLLIVNCSASNLYVIINNHTKEELKNITLEYTGGEKRVLKIAPKNKIKVKIEPTGESSLILTYSVNEKVYTKKINVYFEPSYKGYIKILIDNNQKISIDNGVSLRNIRDVFK